MSQHDAPVPGLRPGREWALISRARPRKYGLFQHHKAPDGTEEDGTEENKWLATLTHSGFLDGWFVSAFLNGGVQWQVRLSESDDPPFELAEVLYDAVC
jgi:hypothetical protein